ncbi:caspase domain-containing protein [Streptomyces sp. NPDC101118]|uniref:caspase family protein n=1 Tax=Streptomyces sp. NPDC101118 TaxID=3366109 RepID=UPI0037F52E06
MDAMHDQLALVARSTVQLLDGQRELVGTAFFIAPGVLLTSDRVVGAVLDRREEPALAVRSPALLDGAVLPVRLLRRMGPSIGWEREMALLELLDPSVEHDCVWLEDHVVGKPLAAVMLGYHPAPSVGEQPQLSPHMYSLASTVGVPRWVRKPEFVFPGLAGSPLVQEIGGGVIGMVALKGGDRGTGALSVSVLRRFRPLYQRVIAAHDLWHGARAREGHASGWVHLLESLWRDDDPNDWRPRDQCAALSLLAELPLPPDGGVVWDLAMRAARGPGVSLDPPGPKLMWRNGLDALHLQDGPLPAPEQLRYLWLVARYAEEAGSDPSALDEWLDARVDRLDDDGRWAVLPYGPRRPAAAPPAPAPEPAPCWQAGGALLVGVGAYDHLPDVPGVGNNLDDLAELLTSAEFGIPPGHLRVLRDPRTHTEIHDALEELAEGIAPAGGALLVYYAGHGRAHPTHGRMLLSLAGSREQRPYSYWEFDQLRTHLVDVGPLTRLVVIDSCYSGSALEQLSGGDYGSAVAIDGTYVMASSGATEPSLAPVGARHTTFTGRLLEALRDGIPGGGPLIDADALFLAVRDHCRAAVEPVPIRQVRNDGARIPLVANKAHWRSPWHTSST